MGASQKYKKSKQNSSSGAQLRKKRLSTRSRKIWSTEAENTFIEIWAENSYDLRKGKKNTPVYGVMASKLRRYGYEMTTAEVKAKIFNLTRKYLTVKKQMGPFDRSPPDWHQFDSVHQIIGAKLIHNTEHLGEESIRGSQNSSAPSISEEYPSTPPNTFGFLPEALISPPSPTSISSAPQSTSALSPKPSRASAKKTDLNIIMNKMNDIDRNLKLIMEEQNKNAKDLKKQGSEQIELLRRITENSERLTNGFLDFLQHTQKN